MSTDQLPSQLAGLRTYLMGFSIIVHQIGKAFGIDVSDDLVSTSIDAILGIGVLFFRWKAAVTPKAGGGK
jgi:hypothetical protein